MENSEMTYEQIIEEICNRTTIDDDFAVTVVTTNDHDRYELRINVDFLEDGSDHNGLSSNPSRSDSLFDQATELDKRQSFTAMYSADAADAEEQAALLYAHLQKALGEQHVYCIMSEYSQ